MLTLEKAVTLALKYNPSKDESWVSNRLKEAEKYCRCDLSNSETLQRVLYHWFLVDSSELPVYAEVINA